MIPVQPWGFVGWDLDLVAEGCRAGLDERADYVVLMADRGNVQSMEVEIRRVVVDQPALARICPGGLTRGHALHVRVRARGRSCAHNVQLVGQVQRERVAGIEAQSGSLNIPIRGRVIKAVVRVARRIDAVAQRESELKESVLAAEVQRISNNAARIRAQRAVWQLRRGGEESESDDLYSEPQLDNRTPRRREPSLCRY